jgi:hypothetical protein
MAKAGNSMARESCKLNGTGELQTPVKKKSTHTSIENRLIFEETKPSRTVLCFSSCLDGETRHMVTAVREGTPERYALAHDKSPGGVLPE